MNDYIQESSSSATFLIRHPERRLQRIWRSFGVFAPQDDGPALRKLAFLLPLLLVCSAAAAQEQLTRLLREPDISGNTIAFVYAGDVWLVDAKGGEARRLTADPGEERFPKFSPDGRQIAFCGQYSGTRQVYVIGTEGGAPKQLTFYNDIGSLPPRGGIDNRVIDWTRDGRSIVFLAHRRPQSDRLTQPYLISAAGGSETPMIIPESGSGQFSPDGTKFVYTPISREFATWKRYRGGQAQDVWIYDLKTNASEQLTNFPGTDNQPMWIGNTIYFTSDREGGRLNLYAYDLGTKQTKKVTNHTDYDVLWPSSSDRRSIVYECGGYLWHFDPASGRDERVPIHLVGDFRGMLPRFQNVSKDIVSWAISPSGARALFTAHGDIFTVPAKNGEIRNLSQTPGTREMSAEWSPDGKWISYLSDKDGAEYEIYVRPAEGTGEERQVTHGGKAWKLNPLWSPDSKKILYSDKDHTLHVVDVASGAVTDVDRGEYNDINDYHWSPDSKWISYVKNNEVGFGEIWLHSLPEGKNYQLTSGMNDDNEPVFDPKGRYLYFTSNRDFNLTFSGFEFNYVYTDPTRVYVGVLAQDGPALFLPQSDEEKTSVEKAQAESTATQKEESKGPEPKPASDAAAKPVKIDVAGFEKRVRAIPAPSGTYNALDATPNGVLYIYSRNGANALKFYNVDDRKEETIVEGAQQYELSANHEKAVYHTAKEWGIATVKGGAKEVLALDRMEMKIDPRVEWPQEFTDAWRILRDWFYDPNMHGLDWNAMREKYGQLVPFIASRGDLDFVLGELGGEINAGHVYVQPADDTAVKRVDNGLLGADIVPEGGYYRIRHIFPGENWNERTRSPLTEPGVKIAQGDYILAVDGRPTAGVDNFYRLLEDKSGRVVTLLVNSSPSTNGAHEEHVRPIAKETDVRYLDWVAGRRAYVEKASGGRIGYIHVPNTAVEGNRELFKYFYPQVNREALIIDDRYNGGGFIPDRMIELLDRPLLNYWIRRNLKPTLTPAYAHEGPKVMLTNGYAGSGGDALPYYFRERKLGTIIGTRTWGGLIGLSGGPALMDGGSVTVPTFRFLDPHGMWAVEGVGVAPDIEVVDRSEAIAAGRDPALEKGVEVLMQQLKEHPPQKLVIPPTPVPNK